jgi:uncharacterized protein YkwD
MGRSKRFAARLLAVTAVIGTAGFFAAPAAQARPATQVTTLQRLHNEVRLHIDERTLPLSSELSRIAREHSIEMSRRQELYHSSNLTTKVRNWHYLGENVGVGPSIPDLHDAFMASPHHRHNIENARYRDIGVGVVKDADGTYWVTVIFRG